MKCFGNIQYYTSTMKVKIAKLTFMHVYSIMLEHIQVQLYCGCALKRESCADQ